MVTSNASQMRGGEFGARDMALQAANKHCALTSKQIEVVQIKSGLTHSMLDFQDGIPHVGVATVTFMCK